MLHICHRYIPNPQEFRSLSFDKLFRDTLLMKSQLCRYKRIAILVSVAVALVLLGQNHLSGSRLRRRSLQLSRATYQQQNLPFASQRSRDGVFPGQIREVESFRLIQSPQELRPLSQPLQQLDGSLQDPYISGSEKSSTQHHAYQTITNGSEGRDGSTQQLMEQSQQQHWTNSGSPHMEGSQRTSALASNMQARYFDETGIRRRDQPLSQVQQLYEQVGARIQPSNFQELSETLQSQPRQQIYSQVQTRETQQPNLIHSQKSEAMKIHDSIPQDQLTSHTLAQHSSDSRLGISVPEQDPQCVVPDAAEKSVRHPVWTASYPGSGAKLTWKLIRAITGIFTSDDHDHNGRVEKGMIVAVKTHYPSHTPPGVFLRDKLKHISRAVLLTRNPINSIPSYHNFVYEQQNGLLNHSTRAPIDAWIKWRNAFFEQELQAWVDHQKYWLNYPSNVFHLISMEHLTSPERGPDTLYKLGQFLANGEADIAESLIPPERITCVWDMFVNSKVPGEAERRHSHRSGGPEVYPFTSDQLDHMIAALKKLKNDHRDSPELAMVLDEYVVTIQQTKFRIDQL